jgi:hypothetical protein
MEVTVVRLRRFGVEIPKAQLDAEPRVRGFMSIEYRILENGKEPRRKIKELQVHSVENANCSPMMTLNSPDQTQLKGTDMMYVGTERVDGVEYPQAWWVRCDPSPPSNGVRPTEYASAGKRAMA